MCTPTMGRWRCRSAQNALHLLSPSGLEAGLPLDCRMRCSKHSSTAFRMRALGCSRISPSRAGRTPGGGRRRNMSCPPCTPLPCTTLPGWPSCRRLVLATTQKCELILLTSNTVDISNAAASESTSVRLVTRDKYRALASAKITLLVCAPVHDADVASQDHHHQCSWRMCVALTNVSARSTYTNI